MPIIIDDNGNGHFVGARKSIAGCEPEDYSPFLTGGYDRDGILNSKLRAYGSEVIPEKIFKLFEPYFGYKEGLNCYEENGGKSIILVKDTSIFRELSKTYWQVGPGEKAKEMGDIGIPSQLLEDTLLTYDQEGEKVTICSRLVLDKIYVFSGKECYVAGEYKLLTAPKKSKSPEVSKLPHSSIILFEQTNQDSDRILSRSISNNPISLLYRKAYKEYEKLLLKSGVKKKNIKAGYKTLAERDSRKPMYDMLVGELELMRNPKVLPVLLRYFAGLSFSMVKKAVRLLGETDTPLELYRTEIVKFIQGYKPLKQFELKMENATLFFASDLGIYQDKLHNAIPFLAGKKYDGEVLKLTAEQVEAIESSDLITVTDGGPETGKTTVIKHRLLHMQHNGIDLKKVCVLTYSPYTADKIKREYTECQVYTFRSFVLYQLRKILREAAERRIQVKESEEFEKYLAGRFDEKIRPEKMEWDRIKMINRLILYLNLEGLKPDYEHIIIDEAEECLNLELIAILKTALKHGVSVFISGYSGKADPWNKEPDLDYIESSIDRFSLFCGNDVVRPEMNTILKVFEKFFSVHKLSVNFMAYPAIMEAFNRASCDSLGDKDNRDEEKSDCPLKMVSGNPIFLSMISERLEGLFYSGRKLQGYNEFKEIINLEAVKLNYERETKKMNAVDPSITGWLERENENRLRILGNLNDPKLHKVEIERLKCSMKVYEEELF